MASAQLCVLPSPDITEMDQLRPDLRNKPVTRQTENRDIVSITEGSTERAVRNNGNWTSGRESTSAGKEKKSTRVKEKKTSSRPRPESPPGVNEEQSRLHRGGKMTKCATGDRKQTKQVTEQTIDRNTGLGQSLQRTGDEKNKKTDVERSKRAQVKITKKTLTLAGGYGRRTVDRDKVRDSGTTRMEKGSVNTGSGNSTCQDHTTEAPNTVDTPLRLDFGRDSHAMLFGIISKLFPLDIKEEPSTSSTEPVIEPAITTTPGNGSPSPSSLSDTLVTVEALGNNFEELAKWFQLFESTNARDVIGFDLAMELCGCYDIIIRRLGNGLRDTFGQTMFIQGPQHVKVADQALQYIAAFVKGDVTRDLKPALQDLLCQSDNTRDLETKTIRTAFEELSTDRGNISSAPQIGESLKVQWGFVVELVCALVDIIQTNTNRSLPGTLESTRHQKDLTFARQENVRLQSECNEARKTIDKLERELSIVRQTATNEELYKDEIQRKALENDNRISELQEVYSNAQSVEETLKREIVRITSEQEHERSAWSVKVQGLVTRLETSQSTIDIMQRDHLTEKDALQVQICTLTADKDTLSQNEAQLKTHIQTTEASHKQDLDERRITTDVLHVSVSQQKAKITELTDTIDKYIASNQELHQTVTTQDMELDNMIKQLQMSKMTLRSLDQLFGFEIANCDHSTVVDRITGQRAASVERIQSVLKGTVIQVMKDDDDDHCYQEHMDTASDTSQLFKDYECEIHNIIQRLSLEHEPMDVSGCSYTRQRRIKPSLKRRLCPNVTLERSSYDHPVCKKQECTSEVKHEANPENTVKPEKREEPNLPVKIESQDTPDNNNGDCCQLRGQENSNPSVVNDYSSKHSNVYMVDIELCENDPNARRHIPGYIAQSLIDKDVKLINLGCEKHIDTLLNVLQVSEEVSEYVVKALSEYNTSTCHCSQMTKLSQILKCSLFICWPPGDEHEIYGAENNDNCVHTIIVYRENRGKLYYLLAVKDQGSYTYNLARLPFESQFQVPKQAFRHISDGSCQGPVVSNPIHSVDTIETSHLVLHGHL